MTKILRKAIIKRSKLGNNFNDEIHFENWSEYKQQRKLCSNLLKQSKRRHFNSLNVNGVTENKKFWKTIKPKKNENKKFWKTIKPKKNPF